MGSQLTENLTWQCAENHYILPVMVLSGLSAGVCQRNPATFKEFAAAGCEATHVGNETRRRIQLKESQLTSSPSISLNVTGAIRSEISGTD